MNDFRPWQSRPKRYRIRPPYEEYRSRRRIPWAWIVAIAAIMAVAGAMALAYDAESAMLPPRPIDTQAKTPPPAGRHETRLYCRHFLPPGEAARRADCRRVKGYR